MQLVAQQLYILSPKMKCATFIVCESEMSEINVYVHRRRVCESAPVTFQLFSGTAEQLCPTNLSQLVKCATEVKRMRRQCAMHESTEKHVCIKVFIYTTHTNKLGHATSLRWTTRTEGLWFRSATMMFSDACHRCFKIIFDFLRLRVTDQLTGNDDFEGGRGDLKVNNCGVETIWRVVCLGGNSWCRSRFVDSRCAGLGLPD